MLHSFQALRRKAQDILPGCHAFQGGDGGIIHIAVQDGQFFFGKVLLEKRGQGNARVAIALARKIEQNETRASVHGQRYLVDGFKIYLVARKGK